MVNNGIKSIEFTNKQLIKLIWPLIMEQFLSFAVGLADSIMVAQVGDAAVSGVSLVDSISVLMVYIFSAMAAGGAAVCGQYIGRAGYNDAKKAGEHLLLLHLAASIIITALLYLLSAPIITKLFGEIEADVMAATSDYYMYVMAAIPAIAIYNAGAALFRSMEKTDITLKVSMVMNAINVGGNAILIFGFGMGVEGVAIPTLVSWWAAAVIMMVLLFNKKYELNLRNILHFRLNARILKNILSLGIPGGIENGMFQLGKIVLYSFISTMGTASITANAIGGTLGNMNVMLGCAVNLALTTVVSQCVGAGAFDKARFYLKKLAKWTYCMQFIWIGALLILTPFILKIYDVDPEATRLAQNIELLHGIATMVIWIPSFMVSNFLKSAGDATFTMIVSAASMWIGRVLGAFILGKFLGMGVLGVWIAHTIIDWSIRSITYFIRYRKEKWTSKAIKA